MRPVNSGISVSVDVTEFPFWEITFGGNVGFVTSNRGQDQLSAAVVCNELIPTEQIRNKLCTFIAKDTYETGCSIGNFFSVRK